MKNMLMKKTLLCMVAACGMSVAVKAAEGASPVFDEDPSLVSRVCAAGGWSYSPVPLSGWDERRLAEEYAKPAARGSCTDLARQGFAALHLSRIAASQGKSAEAADWMKKYEEKRRRVVNNYFDFRTGFYLDRDSKGRFSRERSLNGYWPMLAEMADPTMKDLSLGKLEDPEWFGYTAWCPEWMITIKALDAYGEYALARKFARRLVRDVAVDARSAARLLVEDLIGVKRIDSGTRTVTCAFARNIKGSVGVTGLTFAGIRCDIVATDSKISVRSDGAFTLKANGYSHAVKAGENVFARDRREEVKVSDFDTIQAALDSGAKRIVFDKAHSPFIAPSTLWARSDSEIVFEDGAELVAEKGRFHGPRECLLKISGVENVTLRGEGARGVMRMRRDEYAAKKGKGPNAHGYTWSEWRHCFVVHASRSVRIENMLFATSGGDGMCVGDSRDIVMKNCVCDKNYRQGLSICGARNMLVEDCVFSDTKGTAPQSGVDIEPWKNDQDVVNVVFRNCVAKNNRACGFEVYLRDMDVTSNPVSVLFDGCRTIGNHQAYFVNGGLRRTNNYVKGEVKFRNCSAVAPKNMGFFIANTTADSWTAVIENCTVEGAEGIWTNSDVTFWHECDREPWFSGLRINGLVIRQAKDRPWLAYRGKGDVEGRYPLDVTGNVTVHKVDGTVEKITLDEEYMKQVKCISVTKPKTFQ